MSRNDEVCGCTKYVGCPPCKHDVAESSKVEEGNACADGCKGEEVVCGKCGWSEADRAWFE
jgi:hypothetical protein